MMMFSLPVTVLLTWLTNKLSTGVFDRPKISQHCSRKCNDGALPESNSIVDVGLQAISLGWKEYIQQPVLPAASPTCFCISCGGAGSWQLNDRVFNPTWS